MLGIVTFLLAMTSALLPCRSQMKLVLLVVWMSQNAPAIPSSHVLLQEPTKYMTVTLKLERVPLQTPSQVIVMRTVAWSLLEFERKIYGFTGYSKRCYRCLVNYFNILICFQMWLIKFPFSFFVNFCFCCFDWLQL